MGKRQQISVLDVKDKIKEVKDVLHTDKKEPKDSSTTTESKSDGEQIRLQKNIGLPSACALILGTIIGSGIFVSPKGILREVHSVGLALTIWVGCGILTLIGALVYAELGTMMPQSGGAYVYIKRAFGDFPAFLYMWAISVIVIPAHDAIIALTFARYITQDFFLDCAPPDTLLQVLGVLAIGESLRNERLIGESLIE